MQNKVLSFPLFSQRAISVMRSGRILGKKESPEELFERVVSTISQIETVWGISPKEIDKFSERFANLWKQRVFTLGTPTLTNAGRIDHKQSALSSCVVIPVDLNNKNSAQDTILSYYRQNMGSGFDFTPYENPIELLVWLNSLSAKATATGQYDRYIGNMGNLHVSHPKVHDFIRAKQQHRIPHFNISIDVNDEYMKSVLDETEYILQDGTSIDAKKLFWSIAECAWINGDPGIISLERMNRDNPVSDLAPYTSTPPCSEMGLSPGETCQFGYINVASIIKENGLVDWELLRHATETLTRALDNAIEVSLTKFPDSESTKLAKLKRKIGIGICGVAEEVDLSIFPKDFYKAKFIHLATQLPQHALQWLHMLSGHGGVSVDAFEAFVTRFPEETKRMLEMADIIFLNEFEYSALQATYISTLQKPIILKYGPKGATIRQNGITNTAIATEVSVVDTTGAGDVLAGAFLAQIAEGVTVGNALQKAVDLATFSVTEFGVDHLNNYSQT